MNYTDFANLCQAYDIDLTKAQYQSLLSYAQHLIAYNQKVNLTAIVEMDDIFIKHFLDSLLVLRYIEANFKVGDVGSGAGFPGLVLAIFKPQSQFTLIEPTLKRCIFLNEMVQILNLDNVTIINARAEDLVDQKGSFDIILSRAVARLDILCELCIPLVKVKGYFIALKGAHGLEELDIAKNALKELHSHLLKTDSHTLPQQGELALRHNLIFEKLKQTPSHYPRNYSRIKKQPL